MKKENSKQIKMMDSNKGILTESQKEGFFLFLGWLLYVGVLVVPIWLCQLFS